MKEVVEKVNTPLNDPQLKRNILLDALSIPKNVTATGFSYDDKEQRTVDRQTRILVDDGFLNGFYLRENTGFFKITGLTEKGQHFLENSRGS